MPYRRLASVIAVNLALLLAIAGLTEAVFGKWFSSDPLDRVSLRRDVTVTVPAKGIYAGAENFTLRRDHWGFRGEGVDPAAVTLVTIGGSTTAQLYLPADKTWQAVLQRELAASGGTTVIANAGIDGMSSIGLQRVLDTWLPNVPGLKPRFVLVYVGINDVHVGDNPVDRLEHSSVWKAIRDKSAMVRLWNTVTGMSQAYRQRLNHQAIDFAGSQWTDKPNLPAETRNVEPFKQRLAVIAKLSHDMGAVPILVTQTRGDYRLTGGKVMGLAAAAGSLNGVDQHRLLSQFNAATLEVCHDQRLLCLDLATELNFGEGDFYDHVHNTPQGADKIGRWLAAKLAGLV